MHVQTDLIKWSRVSEEGDYNVWLKLETQQTSGSFKYRGISRLCQERVRQGYKSLISSSGGNAGLAATIAAVRLGVPITVYVPETTPQSTIDRLIQHGANVTVHGPVWDVTHSKAIEMAAKEGSAVIHPFDDPLIWEGHSSIVSEIQSQLGGGVADVIIASVGGGGLMNGILEGMDKVGWSHVPFIAMETIGADSLNACVKAGEWVELDAITSMAKCLGARRVCWKSYESLGRDNVTSCVVSDNDAMRASIMMADDLGIYVPLACGAALAAVTTPSVIRDLQKRNKLPTTLRNVVVIACGGSGVDNDIINHWRSLIID